MIRLITRSKHGTREIQRGAPNLPLTAQTGCHIRQIFTNSKRLHFAQAELEGASKRYTISEDPARFTIDPERLSAREARWSLFFRTVPVLCVLTLCATPLMVVRYCTANSAAAKEDETIVDSPKNVIPAFQCRGLEFIKPPALIDILEGAVPCILFAYRSDTFHSKMVRTMLYEVADVFREHKLPIRVVGIDTATEVQAPVTSSPDEAMEHFQLLKDRPDSPSMYIVSGYIPTENGDSAPPGRQSSAMNDIVAYSEQWRPRDVAMFAMKMSGLASTEIAEEVVIKIDQQLESRWTEFENEIIQKHFCGDKKGVEILKQTEALSINDWKSDSI